MKTHSPLAIFIAVLGFSTQAQAQVQVSNAPVKPYGLEQLNDRLQFALEAGQNTFTCRNAETHQALSGRIIHADGRRLELQFNLRLDSRELKITVIQEEEQFNQVADLLSGSAVKHGSNRHQVTDLGDSKFSVEILKADWIVGHPETLQHLSPKSAKNWLLATDCGLDLANE